jgi:GntR family histidine utilization transcriptional repressor
MSASAGAPYLRVKHFLKGELSRGSWLPGALMPSETELVAQFGVSRMTVNRALRELQAEGLVLRSQGLGSFAAPLNRVSSTLTIRDLHEEIEARGQQHSARVVLLRAEAAPATVPSAGAWISVPVGAPMSPPACRRCIRASASRHCLPLAARQAPPPGRRADIDRRRRGDPLSTQGHLP